MKGGESIHSLVVTVGFQRGRLLSRELYLLFLFTKVLVKGTLQVCVCVCMCLQMLLYMVLRLRENQTKVFLE